jgi:hypothetical protein
MDHRFGDLSQGYVGNPRRPDPDAAGCFRTDPNPLNLFDAEVLLSLQTSQTPAPPSTSPAAPSTGIAL